MRQWSEKISRKIGILIVDSKLHFGYFCEEKIEKSWGTSAKSTSNRDHYCSTILAFFCFYSSHLTAQTAIHYYSSSKN